MIRAVYRFVLLKFVLCCCIFSFAQSSVIDSVINPAACREIVETLAADSFLGRLTTTPECEKAAQYIAWQFSKAGCSPGGNSSSFFIPYSVRWDGQNQQANNVVAVLPGKSKPNEWVIFSAHYDHIGTKGSHFISFAEERGKPEKNDSIYNGANDNASGVSALILLARYFATIKNNERTIVFIAFSGEEMGLFGSRHISNRMNNYDSVVAMINMDMLGVPMSAKNKNPIMTGSVFSDLQVLLNKKLYESLPEKFGKNYFRNDPFKSEHLFRRSDNYWFAQKGIPAHTIIATHPRNRYYHSLNDEPGTLDYELLAKVISAVAVGSDGLIDGSQTPTRINPLRITD
jgi:Zn-dependent M28 family amino/carboxypeptidase